ncbi:hypothetical protein ELBR111191_05420 [Elizabethkingia bruuniana]|nr:hypothetical protein EVD20_07950 [Elizabethkingia bruuniana]
MSYSTIEIVLLFLLVFYIIFLIYFSIRIIRDNSLKPLLRFALIFTLLVIPILGPLFVLIFISKKR